MRHQFKFDGKLHKHVKDVPVHSATDCNCQSCQKSRLHGAQLLTRASIYNGGVQSPVNDLQDHADGPPNPKTAADYIGATLKAAKQVPVSKGGRVVRTAQPGQNLGVVDSWLTNPSRFLLTSGETVPIAPGSFDEKTALESLALNKQAYDAELKAKVDERLAAKYAEGGLYAFGKDSKEAVGDAVSLLGEFGGYIKWALILVVLAVIAGLFLRAKG